MPGGGVWASLYRRIRGWGPPSQSWKLRTILWLWGAQGREWAWTPANCPLLKLEASVSPPGASGLLRAPRASCSPPAGGKTPVFLLPHLGMEQRSSHQDPAVPRRGHGPTPFWRSDKSRPGRGEGGSREGGGSSPVSVGLFNPTPFAVHRLSRKEEQGEGGLSPRPAPKKTPDLSPSCRPVARGAFVRGEAAAWNPEP